MSERILVRKILFEKRSLFISFLYIRNSLKHIDCNVLYSTQRLRIYRGIDFFFSKILCTDFRYVQREHCSYSKSNI